jgi:PAS domain S-box-containing protein
VLATAYVDNVGRWFEPVTSLASIAHRFAERGRAAGRIASRRFGRRSSRTGDEPSAPDVARLFELPFDVMGVASFDGVMRRVNPGIERVLGLAPQDVVGRPLLDMCHPDDREATASAFGAVLEGGELSGFENRLPAADGSYRWLQWNVLADADEGLIYGVARDVTERRNAEEQLRKTQRELEASRDALRALADEQAALRRVATLVAKGAAPTEVFDAVSVEVARLLGAAQVGLVRYENEQEVLVLAMHGQNPAVPRAGMRLPLEGDSVTGRVSRTGRSARINYGEEGLGAIADIARRSNVNITVGAPITVEGRLWGVIPASWEGHTVPPVDAEERLARFAELLDTAIGNADSRDQLTASRARVLTAGDEARRRVVRDLHDGAQQRLVHTIVTLKLAERAVSEDGEQAAALVAEALDHAEHANADLRELAHGVLPSVLTRDGLAAGIDALVSRLDLEVHVELTRTRLPPEIEASAYFIVAEALTNVVKHSQAVRAEVAIAVSDGWLRLQVRDDGIGGADPHGQGLLGVADRVAALGGHVHIESPSGAGTGLAADLPLPELGPGAGE